MDPRLRLDTSPVAHPEAVITGDRWRVSVLTDGLVRLEWAEDGVFEDRASALALHRDLPVPDFEVRDGEVLEVLTERFHLTYDRGPFSPSGLSLAVRGAVTDWHSVWRHGLPVPDLGGTARTLDDADGRVDLEPGVVSRLGYAVLDDSASPVLEADGSPAPRDGSRRDLYVFAYGLDHAEAVQALYALAGPQPLLPRWALGNWWSRYHPYSADSYTALLDRFDAEDVPFSVAVLDMDWHRVDDVDPRHGSGWTGYSWNRELFGDPEAFLATLHERGLRTTLNVHPADGVRSFEDAYPAMARALGRDPRDGHPIAFDVTDPDFVTAYLDVLHHGLEDQGVDFWWIDWQQGPHSRVPGLDPLWLLNHLHHLDNARDGRRPLVLSRYAGPGSHRYPVGFSGDAVISWDSLAFQPEFTATAANIGYGWWSHDIGGHLHGRRDEELMVRWVQYGVLSPVLRLHSSNNAFLLKEPWAYGLEARTRIGEALRLRHRLVPYLHTMNHRAHDEGLPLVRPLYHLHPHAPEAYENPGEYAFGSTLLVAPITSPRDPVTGLGGVDVWLPPGTWTDLHTGVVLDGGRSLRLHRDDTGVPTLLAAGGVLPLAGPDDLDAAGNPAHLEVVVAPGADGSFTLVEDDGTGSEDVATARTPLEWDQAAGTLRIGPATGHLAALPAERTWTVALLAAGGPEEGGRLVVEVPAQSVEEAVTVRLRPDPWPVTSDVPGRLQALLAAAPWENEAKLRAWGTLEQGLEPGATLAELQADGVPPSMLSAISELLSCRRGQRPAV